MPSLLLKLKGEPLELRGKDKDTGKDTGKTTCFALRLPPTRAPSDRRHRRRAAANLLSSILVESEGKMVIQCALCQTNHSSGEFIKHYIDTHKDKDIKLEVVAPYFYLHWANMSLVDLSFFCQGARSALMLVSQPRSISF